MKYHYWQGVRFQATSNAQYSVANGGWNSHVSATRSPSDTYVRSVWWANCSYLSDATQPVPGWWAAASAYFVAEFDHTATLLNTANLNTTEPTGRVAMGGMDPLRFSMPEFTPSYLVQWTTSPDGIITHTSRRKGDGTNSPRIVYGVHVADQNGFFSGAAGETNILRCNIYGRVLWESDVP